MHLHNYVDIYNYISFTGLKERRPWTLRGVGIVQYVHTKTRQKLSNVKCAMYGKVHQQGKSFSFKTTAAVN